MDHKVTTDYTRLLGNANVKVYVRARPCADGRKAPEDMFERKKDNPNNIVIKDTERMQYGNHAFSFDNIYWTDTTQETLFEATSKCLIDYAFNGINSCCFAYGQTGSGKTFSIFGEPEGEKVGLLPRSIEYLFSMINRQQNKTREVTLAVSFLEIYCDRVRDLARAQKTGRPVSYQTSSSTEWFLRQQSHHISRTDSTTSVGSNPLRLDEDYDYEKANFEIHEDAQGQVFVKDLSMVTVTSKDEVDALVQCGLRLRSTHETKMNAVSSRSHTVFTIHIFQRVQDTSEVIYGMLNMVDLAGSERLKKSESDGQRLKEALHINSSLSAVGKVVMSLDPESGYNYIPYRDSKLTRLLQNSIGGNCITTLIATIHPMREHYEGCLETLQFANRCRSVQNQPRVNHITGTIVDKDRRIRRLQEELSVLRRQLEGIRSEYNTKFTATLKELGFQAQEISDDGEVKFSNGSVFKSILSERGQEADLSSDNLIKTTGFGHTFLAEETQGSADSNRLRQKYANAKTNFAVIVSEAKSEKEIARRTINEQKRRIAFLESSLRQKSNEFDRAMVSEAARHREEMQTLLRRNHQIDCKRSTNQQAPIDPQVDDVFSFQDREKQLEKSLRHRMAVLQQSKENDITLIQQQFEQTLASKTEELKAANKKLQQSQQTTTETFESLRYDCIELYNFTGRLLTALGSRQRVYSLPRNILADPTKLRHIKAIMTTGISNLNFSPKIVGNQSARPASAPVRRHKVTYAAALRDRVNQPLHVNK
ncbi:putative kinesin-like protein [Plasmopara halstedii]